MTHVKFTHWKANSNYHRWYFDDRSFIDATRYNRLHDFKIRASGENCEASESLLDSDNRIYTPLMESIYLITDIDLTL